MPTGRSSSGAVHIPKIGILVLGGWKMDESSNFLRTAELLQEFNMDNGSTYVWDTIDPMLKRRWDPCCVYFDEKVFVLCKFDYSLEILPLLGGKIGQWTLISDCNMLPGSPSSMCVYNGRILLARKLTEREKERLTCFMLHKTYHLINIAFISCSF